MQPEISSGDVVVEGPCRVLVRRRQRSRVIRLTVSGGVLDDREPPVGRVRSVTGRLAVLYDWESRDHARPYLVVHWSRLLEVSRHANQQLIEQDILSVEPHGRTVAVVASTRPIPIGIFRASGGYRLRISVPESVVRWVYSVVGDATGDGQWVTRSLWPGLVGGGVRLVGRGERGGLDGLGYVQVFIAGH